MAGIFNRFDVPGPGVSKDEPKKKGAALYFQLFFRHFWDFIKENLMYAICSIPLFLILYFLITFLYSDMQIYANENDMVISFEAFKIFIVISYMLVCGSGPASASMAYMMRCVTREEHCFLFSDFTEKFKENFVQSFAFSVIDIFAVAIVLPTAIKFYYNWYTSTQNILWGILTVVMLISLVLYLFMHIYFYQFIITYELKFRYALKNSLIMAIANFPMNIVIVLIPLGITYFVMSYINPYFILFLAIILWMSFFRYPIEFYATRVINKLLAKSKEEETGSEETEKTEQ